MRGEERQPIRGKGWDSEAFIGPRSPGPWVNLLLRGERAPAKKITCGMMCSPLDLIGGQSSRGLDIYLLLVGREGPSFDWNRVGLGVGRREYAVSAFAEMGTASMALFFL